MLNIWTDLCLFLNRDCRINSSNTGTSKDRFEFYSIFKQSIQTEKYIDFWQLRYFREAHIEFRFGISLISVHRLRYRNDIIPRELLCTVCKDISTQAEIQKWYYSERVTVPCVQGYQYTGWDTEMILFRESYCALCARISVHRLRYRNDIIPRELLYPVCKAEIEDEAHVLFSCKAYEDFRKRRVVVWRVTHVSCCCCSSRYVSWWRDNYLGSVPFLVQSFAKEKRHCNFTNWHIQ